MNYFEHSNVVYFCSKVKKMSFKNLVSFFLDLFTVFFSFYKLIIFTSFTLSARPRWYCSIGCVCVCVRECGSGEETEGGGENDGLSGWNWERRPESRKKVNFAVLIWRVTGAGSIRFKRPNWIRSVEHDDGTGPCGHPSPLLPMLPSRTRLRVFFVDFLMRWNVCVPIYARKALLWFRGLIHITILCARFCCGLNKCIVCVFVLLKVGVSPFPCHRRIEVDVGKTVKCESRNVSVILEIKRIPLPEGRGLERRGSYS